jgi:hypothetical protein
MTESIIPPGTREPFGVYLFETDEAAAALGRHVEYAVFSEAFGDTLEGLTKQFRPYEQASFFICVVDHLRRLPVGMMRVLIPSPAGFKSLNEIEPIWGIPAASLIESNGLALDPRSTWDVAMMGVLSDYRDGATGGLVNMALFQALARCAHACDIRWFVAVLTVPAFRMIRWKLHLIFAGYDGITPRQYQGSPASIPAWCDVACAEQKLADADGDLYRVLIEGVGLEPAVRPLSAASIERLRAQHLQAAAPVEGLMPAQHAAAGFLAS